jgi:hypothetical protein
MVQLNDLVPMKNPHRVSDHSASSWETSERWEHAEWDGWDNGGWGNYETNDHPHTIREVPNVALADATEKQKPSPWTKNMFKVRRYSRWRVYA